MSDERLASEAAAGVPASVGAGPKKAGDPGQGHGGAAPNPPAPEDLYRFINRTSAYLKTSRDLDAVLRHYVRQSAEYFGADDAAMAVLEPGAERASVIFTQPADAEWDLEFLEDLIRKRRPRFPLGVICAGVQRRDRPWGLIVLRRRGEPFGRPAEKGVARVAEAMGEVIERIDLDRLAEVRARIDRKIVRRLPPVDVYYHVLDGLHSLTGYDHSAALFILDSAGRSLTMAAERLAWGNRKSPSIGTVLVVPDEVRSVLGEGAVYGFDRAGERWEQWTGTSAGGLADLVSTADSAHREDAMLCAVLGTSDGTVGILKLAARRPGTFGPWECDIVREFAWLVGFVLERAQSIANLHAQMIGAHRRHALADLARGVAHDLNNAMGEMLPLVQQMRHDLESGVNDAATFEADLDRIETSLQVCRSIFGSMLRFARGSSRTMGHGNVRKALEATCAVLEEGFDRQQVELRVEIPDDLPDVRCGQSDLEQLFLNLATNAREAMPGGGSLRIDVTVAGGRVVVRFVDTGRGIAPDLLQRIEQPFFTTKPDGTGLGLSTCRAIVTETRGDMTIESVLDAGTTIVVALPIADGVEA